MWRSLLFIPATADNFLAKAHQRGADAIILDLEDSIPADRKAQARHCIAAAVARLRAHGLDVLVRINAPWRLAVRDLEAAVLEGVTAIMAPKVAGPDHVNALDETIAELESERGLASGSVKLIGLIETPAALLQAAAIARASPRLQALTLGGEDFALALGAAPSIELLRQPCQDLQIACKAAGRDALGHPGSIAEFRDLAAYRRSVEAGRDLGFEGGAAIHPAQVAILNEVFSPSAADIDFARRCVTAYENALREGKGAISLDGKMIDVPVVERARALLARAARR